MTAGELALQISTRKAELDRLRPLTPHALKNLEHIYDLELTYSSNAIEGNALSPAETALVVEQGIAIGGKPLRDHLEAIYHFEAIRSVRDLASRSTVMSEMDIRSLHSLVVRRSNPDIAER